jgi:hypothetical protein
VAFKDRLGKLNDTVERLKTQASTVAEVAQEQARLGQQRLEQFQTKKQTDQLLLELGGLAYLDQAGRLDDEGRQRMATVLEQIRAAEAANGPITVTRAVPAPGATGSYVPGGAGSAAATQAGGAPAGDPGGAPAAPPMPTPAAPSMPTAASTSTAPSTPATPVGGGPLPRATYASDAAEADGPEQPTAD